MAKYGFEIAQRGIDIEKAAEWEKVASSQWAYLPIKAQGMFNVPDGFPSDPSAVVLEHDLNYLSPFILYEHNTRNAAGWELSRNTLVTNDKTKLMVQPDFSQATIFYVLFDYNLDRTENFDFGKGAPDSTSNQNNEGIKALNDTGVLSDITSSDYRRFSINTGARNMAVHLSGLATAVNNTITVNHNLGYLPTYLLYKVTNGVLSIVNNIVSSDLYTLTIKGAQAPLSGDYYYVILKEPFVITL